MSRVQWDLLASRTSAYYSLSTMAKPRSRISTRVLIERVFSQPTAPFREGWVRNAIESILEENKVPYFHDGAGNLIAGASSRADLKNARVALFAHMDHPGFHLGEHVRGGVWRCYWFGGAPFHLMKGSRVRLRDPERPGRSLRGTVLKLETGDLDKDGIEFLVEFGEKAHSFSKSSFGSFDFPLLKIDGDVVATAAADDLAGCVIALGAVLDHEAIRKNSQNRTVAIFTRGEEVGFIGCLDFLEKKVLPRSVWCISLEASKALPEAEFGKGPVLRIGDKATLFNSEFCGMLFRLAQDLQKETPKFKFQRKLMNGGTCEATPLTLYSYTVSAIAVPLLNYHNTGKTRPQPEKISLSDVEGARKLCFEFAQRFERLKTLRESVRKNIFSHFSDFRKQLKTDIRYLAPGEIQK